MRSAQRRDVGSARFIVAFFWVVAVVSLVVGVGVTYYQLQLLSTAEPAAGTITGFATSTRRTDDRTTTMYSPLIRFTTADGEEIVYSPNTSSSRPSAEVGDRVDILYDPANPTRAVINSFWQKWFGTAIAGLLAVVFGGSALLVSRLTRTRTRTGSPEPAEPPPTDQRRWIIEEDGPGDSAT